MAGATIRSWANASAGAVDVTAGGSVSAAAFSPGATSSSKPSTMAALSPTKPFGASVWVGVAAITLLVVIRHSLPR